MGSINAQQAALKVAEKVRKGKKVILGEILREVGYSESVASRPRKVTDTESFKKAFGLEQMALIDGIQSEINRIKVAMSRKNLDNEEYRVLAGSLDILTKNYQLLSGGATERQVFVLPSEVMSRNAIAPTDQKLLPSEEDVSQNNGSTKP